MYGKLRASDQRTLNRSVASKCIPQTFQSPSHGNLEVLKKSPEKPGEWDLKPGDFKNMEISNISGYLSMFECVTWLNSWSFSANKHSL